MVVWVVVIHLFLFSELPKNQRNQKQKRFLPEMDFVLGEGLVVLLVFKTLSGGRDGGGGLLEG